jgi:hypothetical protein
MLTAGIAKERGPPGMERPPEAMAKPQALPNE